MSHTDVILHANKFKFAEHKKFKSTLMYFFLKYEFPLS